MKKTIQLPLTPDSRADYVIFHDDFYYDKRSGVSVMSEIHYHNHYEIYYLISGTQNYFIDNAYVEVNAGDIVLIPKYVLHKTTEGMGGLRILVNFNDAFLDKYFSPQATKIIAKLFEKRIVHVNSAESKKILNDCNVLHKAYENNDYDDAFLAIASILLCVNDCPAKPNKTVSQDISLVNEITLYVQKNYNNITCLDDVAKAMFVSKYHICHCFSKTLQISFNDYLTKVRLQNAEKNLMYTDMNISEIAESCGFNTTTYFCCVFKKHFGIAPLKYRSLLRANLPQSKHPKKT